MGDLLGPCNLSWTFREPLPQNIDGRPANTESRIMPVKTVDNKKLPFERKKLPCTYLFYYHVERGIDSPKGRVSRCRFRGHHSPTQCVSVRVVPPSRWWSLLLLLLRDRRWKWVKSVQAASSPANQSAAHRPASTGTSDSSE